MARPASSHPTDGELEILHVLWEHGPLSLSEICSQLREHREVATTTVATMLRLMLDKKLVRRKQAGRSPQWSAAISRDKTTRSMVGKLLDRVFDGSAQQLVAHLIEEENLSEEELAELRKLIRTKQTGNKPPEATTKRNQGKTK